MRLHQKLETQTDSCCKFHLNLCIILLQRMELCTFIDTLDGLLLKHTTEDELAFIYHYKTHNVVLLRVFPKAQSNHFLHVSIVLSNVAAMENNKRQEF